MQWILNYSAFLVKNILKQSASSILM